MASLDRQVTQNGLGVINAMARGIYNDVVKVTIHCDDESKWIFFVEAWSLSEE